MSLSYEVLSRFCPFMRQRKVRKIGYQEKKYGRATYRSIKLWIGYEQDYGSMACNIIDQITERKWED